MAAQAPTRLIGGLGEDIYVIDSVGDVVIENGVSKGGYDYRTTPSKRRSRRRS